MWRSHASFAKRTSLGVAQHHLPKANIIQKEKTCQIDKSFLFVGVDDEILKSLFCAHF